MRPRPVVVLLALVLAATSAAAAAGAAASATGPAPAATSRGAASDPSPERYSPVPPRPIICATRTTGRVNLHCVVGHSRQGRAIVAKRQGDPNAPRVLVVSGQMHGDEWPGTRVVGAVRKLTAPAGLQVWTIRTMNPDGYARRQRHNARGVDLNRNFPAAWRPKAYSGRRALSEPESRAMARLLTWVQPDLLVSFHGFSESVDTTGGGRRAAAARQFSRLAHIGPAEQVPCGGPCSGNLTDWYSAVSRVGGVAFTVEMPHSSRGTRRCRVPAGKEPMSVISCAALASVALASRTPRP